MVHRAKLSEVGSLGVWGLGVWSLGVWRPGVLMSGNRASLGRATKRFSVCLLLVPGMSLLLSASTSAQQINSTISGLVTDVNESVVPNANVTVQSAQLGIKRIATSGVDGHFVVTNLPVGEYRVTVAAEGFAQFVREKVKVDVGNTMSMTIQLTVKEITQQVNVSDTEYQTINRENANVETLISGTQVTELALNGRNWAQLVNLAPGTSSLVNDSQQGTSVRIDDTAINGLRRRTAPTLDGIGNVDHGSVGTQVNNISVDAIAGGLTTNIAVLVAGGGTNTLCFTNGVLRAVQ